MRKSLFLSHLILYLQYHGWPPEKLAHQQVTNTSSNSNVSTGPAHKPSIDAKRWIHSFSSPTCLHSLILQPDDWTELLFQAAASSFSPSIQRPPQSERIPSERLVQSLAMASCPSAPLPSLPPDVYAACRALTSHLTRSDACSSSS